MPREGADQLGNDSKSRQDHDVHGRMRVEPEEVLEKNGIPSHRRVEDTDAHQSLQE